MILSREAIQRMITDEIGGGGGGAGISGSALANLLTGYATQDWVGENYISIEFFSRLFQAHGTENNQQTDITPNDMDSTITSIEALFGFWTDLYISALGNGGSIGSSIYLSTLADVQLSSPATGQVLTYNATTGKWVNTNAQAGVTQLSALSDVTLTSPQTNQVLIYDYANSCWVNRTLKTVNGYSLIGSGNIDASGGGTGNYLPLAGGIMTGSIGFNNNSTYIDQYGNIHYPSTTNAYWNLYSGNNLSLCCNWLGNIAIGGVATSNDKLKVFGNISTLTLGFYTTNAPYFDINGNLYISNANGAYWNIYNYAGNGIFQINGQNQNIGIGGIAESNDKLKVFGNISTLTLGFYTANAPYFDMYGNLYISNANSAYWTVRNYSSDIAICCDGQCRVGIGGIASYKLHVVGDIYATGAVTALSDARKKDVIGDIGEKQGVKAIGVEQIADAPAVQFLWKGERAKEGVQVGTLAQYWQGVLPEVVMDKGGELSMQYGVAALVSAIITARKVVDHERRITELERNQTKIGLKSN